MQEMELKRRSQCPISFSLDVFGDKWSLLILRDILFYNRSHFRDFMPMERVATNILSDRLNKLESAGFITKTRDSRFKNQFVYDTTLEGWSLLPLLIEMTLWGLEYDPESLASQEFIKRVQEEKPKVVREITRAIKRRDFTAYRRTEMGIDPK